MANEIQKYTFSAVPTAGSWKPVYDSNPSPGSMNDANTGADLATYLAQITGIDSAANVSCSGNYTSGMTVQFVGALANTDMLTLSHQDNTLVTSGGSVSITTVQEGGGGANEKQRIEVSGATGGSFVLGVSELGSNPTLTLPLTTASIEAAFTAVSCAVTCTADAGGFLIEFSGSPLSDLNVNEMTLASNSLTTDVSISVSVLQEGSASSGSPQSPLNLLLLGVG